MAETTGISWTDASWNPWMGCSKVSPGCDNCYMFRDMRKYGRDPDVVTRTKPFTFNAPLRWKDPKLIFTCSWSDFFHKAADPWREEAWDIILRTPHHTYQILTKRPGLMVAWAKTHPWPDHVWAGTSVESQKYAPRLDVLARVPAKIRFVSVEPLLGPVYLTRYFHQCTCEAGATFGTCTCKGLALNQVIVGGESGPGYRPMQLEWLEDLAVQCDHVGASLFVKQDSGPRPGQQGRIPAALWARKEVPLLAAEE